MSAVIAECDIGDVPLDPAPHEFTPAGTNLIVTRSALQVTGGFSPTHYRHMDLEFGQRARQLGLTIRYDPRVVVCTEVPPHVFSKRYFRRWYFKQGIAAALAEQTGSAPWWGPSWRWRQMAEMVAGDISARVTKRPALAFEKHLRAWHLAGYIATRWHDRFRPTRQGEWVSRWSQKRSDTY